MSFTSPNSKHVISANFMISEKGIKDHNLIYLMVEGPPRKHIAYHGNQYLDFFNSEVHGYHPLVKITNIPT
jgi:hypothetical protein